MTVKEGEQDDVPIEEKMKLANPLLTQPSTSDKGNQMGIGVGEIWNWMGVSNMAEAINKLQEAMYKANGDKKKVELIEEPQDVHVNSQ